MGVWIETKAELDIYEAETSLLMWECGLKPAIYPASQFMAVSLLMWECGLKPKNWDRMNQLERVTPYVGVWIETLVLSQ